MEFANSARRFAPFLWHGTAFRLSEAMRDSRVCRGPVLRAAWHRPAPPSTADNVWCSPAYTCRREHSTVTWECSFFCQETHVIDSMRRFRVVRRFAGAVRGVWRAGQFVLDLRAGTVDGNAGHTRIGGPRRLFVLLPLRKPGENHKGLDAHRVGGGMSRGRCCVGAKAVRG